MLGEQLPIIIAGPTGCGKSSLAMEVAQELNGTIICGDSRQLYIGMHIGVAGPSKAETEQIPHKLYNTVHPDTDMSAGDFVDLLDEAIAETQEEGRWPIVVGGSGLYLRSFRFGLGDVPKKDPRLRAELEQWVEDEGPFELHRALALVDPEMASQIEPVDAIRLVRAHEIYRLTGQRPSLLRRLDLNGVARIKAFWYLCERPVPELDERIHARAVEMFAAGLAEEATNLRRVLGAEHKLLSTMGYAEALDMAAGHIDYDEALEKTYRRQRRYAKRQRTWFKKEPWWKRIDLSRSQSMKNTLPALLKQVISD